MPTPNTQTSRKEEPAQSQALTANQTLPDLPKNNSNTDLVRLKGERNFEIKIDKDSQVGFAYQVKTDSGTARGEFPAKAASTIEINDKRLSYTRNKDGILDLKVDPSVYGITAVIHDKNGGVSRIDLIRNGVALTDSNPTPAPAEKAPPAEQAKQKDPIITLAPPLSPDVPTPAPDVSLKRTQDPSNTKTEPKLPLPQPEITAIPQNSPQNPQQNSMGDIFGTARARGIGSSSVIQLPPPPSLPRAELASQTPASSKVALPEQAKPKSAIPSDILVKAQIKGLDKSEFDLIKKDENTGRFSFCKGDTCTDLGFSGAERASTPATPTAKTQENKSTESAPATAPTKEPEFSLSKIPPDAKLKYEIQYPDGKGRGEIDLSKYSNYPVKMGGIGTFAKNSDGTIKFSPDASFNGKIGQGDSLLTPKPESTPATKAAPQTTTDLQSGAHVTPAQAKEYLRAHPNEDVIVVVTDPPNCAPCRNYDPLLPGIIKGLANRAKVLIVDNAFARNGIGEFNLTNGIPATLHFPAGRSNPTSSARNITGPTVLERINEMLNRGRGSN